MNLTWLEVFIPMLRCPDTRQELRWATTQELMREGLSANDQALIRQDGSRLFYIEDGIPNLLPIEQSQSGSTHSR